MTYQRRIFYGLVTVARALGIYLAKALGFYHLPGIAPPSKAYIESTIGQTYLPTFRESSVRS